MSVSTGITHCELQPGGTSGAPSLAPALLPAAAAISSNVCLALSVSLSLSFSSSFSLVCRSSPINTTIVYFHLCSGHSHPVISFLRLSLSTPPTSTSKPAVLLLARRFSFHTHGAAIAAEPCASVAGAPVDDGRADGRVLWAGLGLGLWTRRPQNILDTRVDGLNLKGWVELVGQGEVGSERMIITDSLGPGTTAWESGVSSQARSSSLSWLGRSER